MVQTAFLHGVHETIAQKTAFRNTNARFWVHHSIRLYNLNPINNFIPIKALNSFNSLIFKLLPSSRPGSYFFRWQKSNCVGSRQKPSLRVAERFERPGRPVNLSSIDFKQRGCPSVADQAWLTKRGSPSKSFKNCS